MYSLDKKNDLVNTILFDKGNVFLLKWESDQKRKISVISMMNENLMEETILAKGSGLGIAGMKITNNFYWISHHNGKQVKIDKTNFTSTSIEWFPLINLTDNFILATKRSKNKKRIACYKETTEELLWEQNFSSARFLHTHEKIFCMPAYESVVCNHVIHALDATTGELLWTHEEDVGYSIEELIELKKYIPVKISKILGVHEDILWLGIEKEIIVGINVDSGEETYRKQLGNNTPDFSFGSQFTHLDTEQGKIIGLVGFHYWELDLATKEVEDWDLREEFNQKKTRAGTSRIYLNEFIIFLGRYNEGHGFGRYNYIGAFNRITKKIEWKYIFDFNEEPARSYLTRFGGNKQYLYAIDTSWNCYLFKRTGDFEKP